MTAFSDVSAAKLASSGLTPDYALEHGVRPVAGPEDLPEEFRAMGWATTPGMLFPWWNPRDPEQVAWQYRPDKPPEDAPKYIFAPGRSQKLAVIRPASTDTYDVAIVEGTLQSLAFARYAPADVMVYAIPGCWGWSARNADTDLSYPTTELELVNQHGVRIFLDADARTNAAVYQAGLDLGHACKVYGARDVWFGQVPGRGDTGVDDLLGNAEQAQRGAMVVNLLNPDNMVQGKPASTKPPGKPRAKSAYGLATAEGLPDPNDTLMGTVWADTHRDRFRWLTDQETWFGYRDGRWSRVGATVPGSTVMNYLSRVSEKFFAAARGKDGEAREKLEDTGRMLLAGAKRQSVLNTAANYDAVHLTFDETDQHPMKFCVANGVLDLETLEVTPHDPDLLLTTGTDVGYLPGAPCPRFDEFFAEVQPDPDVRAFLLRVFFMAMVGEVREHVLVTLIGEGRNGKGTLLRIMSELFGGHATVINAKSLLKQRFESHEEEIASLAGKRLVTTEETGQDTQWNVARINSWTGGDRLTGRFMHKDRFSFKPSHTLVLATNHRPNVGQGERAFWARYKEVPFEVCVEGREDLTLEPHVLAYELPGVLNRLIEAGRDYLSSGLREPVAVSLATAEAKVDSDPLFQFSADLLEWTGDHDNSRLTNSEMHDGLLKWWGQNVREVAPPGVRTFPKMMRLALGLPADANNPRKLGKGSSSKLTWTGFRWRGEGAIPRALEDQREDQRASADQTRFGAVLSSPNYSHDSDHTSSEVEVSAATAGGAAAKSVANGDHENDITPGRDLGSDESAATADKSTGSSGGRKRDTEECDNTIDSMYSTDTPGAIASDRQTRQTSGQKTTSDKIKCTACPKIINAAGAARHGGRCGRCSKIDTTPGSEECPPWS